MTRYLLDTDICSFALRNAGGIRKRLARVKSSDLAVSTVTLAEGWTGSRKSASPERWLTAWRHLVAPWVVLDFDAACADVYSSIRSTLERRGTMIGGNDCMIAATALANELVLVTHNVEEFDRVPGLRVTDWTR
jgi:tRNA(fMet)-specific endonuclease VapC